MPQAIGFLAGLAFEEGTVAYFVAEVVITVAAEILINRALAPGSNNNKTQGSGSTLEIFYYE